MGALARAISAIRNIFGSNPGALAAAGRAIGLGGSATVGKILSAAKDNPMTTALVLLQAGEAGVEALDALVSEYPELRSIVDNASPPDDAADFEGIGNIAQFRDEFNTLSTAIASLGGSDRFFAIRRAMQMSDATVSLYFQVKDLR